MQMAAYCLAKRELQPRKGLVDYSNGLECWTAHASEILRRIDEKPRAPAPIAAHDFLRPGQRLPSRQLRRARQLSFLGVLWGLDDAACRARLPEYKSTNIEHATISKCLARATCQRERAQNLALALGLLGRGR